MGAASLQRLENPLDFDHRFLLLTMIFLNEPKILIAVQKYASLAPTQANLVFFSNTTSEFNPSWVESF